MGWFVGAICVLVANPLAARTLEAGHPIAFVGLGPSRLIDSRLGGSDAFLMLDAGLEYPFDKNWSAVGEALFGLASTRQVKLRGGARYHLSDLNLPVTPYAEGQVVAGRLFDVLGADLSLWGVRAGVGADYFFTAKLLAGLKAGYEIARTTGPNGRTFGQFEWLLTADYVF